MHAYQWHKFRLFSKQMWHVRVVGASRGKDFDTFLSNFNQWKNSSSVRADHLQTKNGKRHRFQFDCLEQKYENYVKCEKDFQENKDREVRKTCKESALFDSYTCLRVPLGRENCQKYYVKNKEACMRKVSDTYDFYNHQSFYNKRAGECFNKTLNINADCITAVYQSAVNYGAKKMEVLLINSINTQEKLAEFIDTGADSDAKADTDTEINEDGELGSGTEDEAENI